MSDTSWKETIAPPALPWEIVPSLPGAVTRVIGYLPYFVSVTTFSVPASARLAVVAVAAISFSIVSSALSCSLGRRGVTTGDGRLPGHLWVLSALIVLMWPTLAVIGTSVLAAPLHLPAFTAFDPLSASGLFTTVMLFVPPGIMFLWVQTTCHRRLVGEAGQGPGAKASPAIALQAGRSRLSSPFRATTTGAGAMSVD